jgi:hypothetical protein
MSMMAAENATAKDTLCAIKLLQRVACNKEMKYQLTWVEASNHPKTET